MEKEGGSLVDRPYMPAADIFSGGMGLLFARSGDRLRRLRRAVHVHLQPKAAETYEGIQAEAAKDVILDILNDPKRHAQHAERYVSEFTRGSAMVPSVLLLRGVSVADGNMCGCACSSYAAAVILRVTYGKASPISKDDPEVVRVHQMSVNFEVAMKPGAYLVDRIPWLKYVPGYGRQLKEFRRYELALFRDQLNRVKHDMVRFILEVTSSFHSYCLSRQGTTLARHLARLSSRALMTTSYRTMRWLVSLAACSARAQIAYVLIPLAPCPSEMDLSAPFQTKSVITIMIMAAACHPDAQARVQEELDEVIGRDRGISTL